MTEEQIIKNIDSAISELVYDKLKIVKAYNYYNCKRDPDQFRHLEENYGIGTPTKIEFVPLVRKHIDALIGDYVSIPTKLRITCKDHDTLNTIMQDKNLEIKSNIYNFYKKKLNTDIIKSFSNPNTSEPLQADPFIEKELRNIMDSLELNYTSEYEKAAQNIIKHVMESRNVDFLTKKTILTKDLFVSGTAYYKVVKNKNGTDFNIEVLNPIHTFIDRNPNSIYLKDSYRSVVRRYMHRTEILNKYGHLMEDDAIEEVKNCEQAYPTTGNTFYVRSEQGNESSNGIIAGLELTPGIPTGKPENFTINRLIEVLEVEWLDVEQDKDTKEFITYRYEGMRINGSIYIPIGKVEECVRSISEPTNTCLTVNGMFFSDRNGEPFSLVNATANLQDRFDIINFYRDNAIAASGGKGDWLDLPSLPTALGENITERLLKWKAYKKQMGVAIIDTSQDQVAPMNTTFAGYDDTLQASTMQAFDYALMSLENTCSSITGVSRERLANGIEQRDAVTNVEVGVRMSAIVTKQYFQTLDTLVKEILTDSLNMAKIVYKKGITGVLTLGEKENQIFTALPEHYTMSDFDINVNDSSEFTRDFETIKLFTQELIKAGAIDAETAIDTLDIKSMTDLKNTIRAGMKKKREEQGAIAQLQQQLQQTQQQLQQSNTALQQTQKELQKQSEQHAKAEHDFKEQELELKWQTLNADKEYKRDSVKAKEDLIKAEIAQLYDSNLRNNEIKND